MKTAYLLPCACGEMLRVDNSQAGLTLTCHRCSAQVTVPTLRGLSQLQPDTSYVATPDRVWGSEQRFTLAGILLLLFGLGMATIAYLGLPPEPKMVVNLSEIQREVDGLTIEELPDYFEMLCHGLDRNEMLEYTYHRYLAKRAWTFILIGLAIAAAGAITALAAKTIKRQKPAVRGSAASRTGH